MSQTHTSQLKAELLDFAENLQAENFSSLNCGVGLGQIVPAANKSAVNERSKNFNGRESPILTSEIRENFESPLLGAKTGNEKEQETICRPNRIRALLAMVVDFIVASLIFLSVLFGVMGPDVDWDSKILLDTLMTFGISYLILFLLGTFLLYSYAFRMFKLPKLGTLLISPKTALSAMSPRQDSKE